MTDTSEEIIFFWVLVFTLPVLGFSIAKVNERTARATLLILACSAILSIFFLEKSQGEGTFAPEYTLKKTSHQEVLSCERVIFKKRERWNAHIKDMRSGQTRPIYFRHKPPPKFEVGETKGWGHFKQIEMHPINDEKEKDK